MEGGAVNISEGNSGGTTYIMVTDNLGSIVQMPDFSQSFNRYSYCLNNPLKYTDPDGELAWLAVGLAIVGGYLGGVSRSGCRQVH